jgi:pimeloyl-ACP methyl ester carboxylesterase
MWPLRMPHPHVKARSTRDVNFYGCWPWWAALAGTLLVAALMSSCQHDEPLHQDLTAPSQLPWVRKSTNNTGVIIFIHGVLGSALDTWTNGDNYWPELLTKDRTFDGQDIYVYSFPSRMRGRSFSVDEVAENLRLVLSTDGVLGYRQLTFVSHSMGGLVTRAFLVKYQREIAPKVRFLYFFATPTTGSPYATLARLASQNPQFPDMYPLDVDTYLAPLQSNWLAANLKLRSYCAYETQPVLGQIIVARQSATNLCTERLDPIDADHFAIVKPASEASTAYRAFKSAFQETGVGLPLKGGLNIAIDAAMQAVPVLGALGEIGGDPVFCEAASFSVVLSHDQTMKTPILVKRVGVTSELVTAGMAEQAGLKCEVDTLNLKAYGLVALRQYHFTVKPGSVKAQYLGGLNPSDAIAVDSANVFATTVGTEALHLSPEGRDAHYAFTGVVRAGTQGMYRMRFEAAYDVAGEPRVALTKWLYVFKGE